MTPAEFKQARQSLGLTAQQVADILGVNISTVQKWEAPITAKTSRAPDPIAVRAMQWMLDGFRPIQWPNNPIKAVVMGAPQNEPGAELETGSPKSGSAKP